MANKTVTTGMHEYAVDDQVTIQLNTLDRRWWKRLWHFLTFRAPPMKTETVTATVTSGTKLALQPGNEVVIPAVDDRFLTWPGKDQGKPKPPIIWLDD